MAGITVKNRLTPMFVTLNVEEVDRLYTIRPQLVLGAAADDGYMDTPDTGAPDRVFTPPYYNLSNTEAWSISGYPYFFGVKPPKGPYVGHRTFPRAAFWLFTSNTSPWAGKEFGDILKPLYTMNFRREIIPPVWTTCDIVRHVYLVSDAEVAAYGALTPSECTLPFGAQWNYRFSGIEGYILDRCPQGFNCNDPEDPSAPQALYRRYDPLSGRYILLMHSQLSQIEFSAFNASQPYLDAYPNATPIAIGFVFPNIDTDGDGLPDGMERLYGLNRLSVDSDCDGLSDGIEFPLTGIQAAGYDPKNGVCP